MKVLRLLLTLWLLFPVAGRIMAQDCSLTCKLPSGARPDVVLVGPVAVVTDTTLIERAIHHYLETHVSGFQQSSLPNFIIAGRGGKTMLGIGGYVSFRTAYDFRGMVRNTDFIPADIPVPGTYDTRQKLRMDASTSRLFFKAIANTRRLGRITLYIETDFRGYNDVNLRLRQAYVSFKGWLFGRNSTTFCDLNASPTTIDFQGPNAYNFLFNEMIRYTHDFSPHWTIAAALELPQMSATYTDRTKPINQRLPDLPLYVQWNFGRQSLNHLRATAVFRDLCYYDTEQEKRASVFGWGVQLSGSIRIGKRIETYFSGVYGQGITPYIQDLDDLGLDLVPDPRNSSRMQALPMYGWYAAAQYNFTPDLFASGGYSQVRVCQRRDLDLPAMYRLGQYVFGNLFYNLTPKCQIALEYLHGVRCNQSREKNFANRLQAMIRYNF